MKKINKTNKKIYIYVYIIKSGPFQDLQLREYNQSIKQILSQNAKAVCWKLSTPWPLQ